MTAIDVSVALGNLALNPDQRYSVVTTKGKFSDALCAEVSGGWKIGSEHWVKVTFDIENRRRAFDHTEIVSLKAQT